MDTHHKNAGSQATATFAAGCFWCTEAIFQQLKGVHQVTSGYTGGDAPTPSYTQVSTGTTGHAEAIQVTFDPTVISYTTLLDIFWKTHDPTTPNQQGADVGPQYRSAIFYHSEAQKEAALASREQLEASGVYPNPIVTEIEPFIAFHPAETEHQDFYQSNQNHPYCQIVIDPKLDKLRKEFTDVIQPN